FPDGMVVTGASAEYPTAIGARVLTIGGMTPDQLLAEVAPYIPHENDRWLRQMVPEFIRPRAVLEHFGLTDPEGRVVLSLEKPGGAPFTLTVTPIDPRTPRIAYTEALHVTTPLFRTHPGKLYWYEFLP